MEFYQIKSAVREKYNKSSKVALYEAIGHTICPICQHISVDRLDKLQ